MIHAFGGRGIQTPDKTHIILSPLCEINTKLHEATVTHEGQYAFSTKALTRRWAYFDMRRMLSKVSETTFLA